MQESERWSAEQLKEAEALDNDELKKRSVALLCKLSGSQAC